MDGQNHETIHAFCLFGKKFRSNWLVFFYYSRKQQKKEGKNSTFAINERSSVRNVIVFCGDCRQTLKSILHMSTNYI